MQKKEMKQMIERLLEEMEEEDIGIGLLDLHCQDSGQLKFFSEPDSGHVKKILKKLSDDSKRHKKILERIITHLGKKYHEK